MDTHKRKYEDALERAIIAHKDEDRHLKATLEEIFPELKESEDELTWLTKYIEEEAYSLSMDIRDNEDRVKLKKLQRSLAWLEKQGEQKSAEWSEDDNEHAESILERLEDMCNKDSTFTTTRFAVNQDIDWLKFLKDRVQPKHEWSDEDNKWIKSLIQTFEDGYFEGFNQLKSYGVIDWLKSLKERIKGE